MPEIISVFSDVVALILDSALPDEELFAAVGRARVREGLPPWSHMEAEVYTYGKRVLVIARPAAPVTQRVAPGTLRLKR